MKGKAEFNKQKSFFFKGNKIFKSEPNKVLLEWKVESFF